MTEITRDEIDLVKKNWMTGKIGEMTENRSLEMV